MTMFKSVKTLAKQYDVSEKTVRRVYKRMLEDKTFSYEKDYVKIGGLVRINEKSFLRGSKWE